MRIDEQMPHLVTRMSEETAKSHSIAHLLLVSRFRYKL